MTTRQDAIRLGLKRYCNGVPCKHGNIAERFVGTSHCLCPKCKAESVEKAKRWRHKNPEKATQHAIKQRARHPDRITLVKKNHYMNNKEVVQKKQKAYRLSNIQKLKNAKKQYYLLNKEKVQALSKKRKLAKAQAVPIWFNELDEFVAFEAYKLSQQRSRLTGFEWHVDHMLPIRATSVCGLHVWNNIQVIPSYLNLTKRHRLMFTNLKEWVKHA